MAEMDEKENIAVLEPIQKTKRREKTKENAKQKPKLLPRYRVILWNDDDHSFQYVIRMMRKIFGYDKTRGMIIACGVHACGKTPVATLPLEVAELRRDQIRSFGPDPMIDGSVSSMYATLEPLEEK